MFDITPPWLRILLRGLYLEPVNISLCQTFTSRKCTIHIMFWNSINWFCTSAQVNKQSFISRWFIIQFMKYCKYKKKTLSNYSVTRLLALYRFKLYMTQQLLANHIIFLQFPFEQRSIILICFIDRFEQHNVQ